MKVCSKCGISKSEDEYYKKAKGTLEPRSECKECTKKKRLLYVSRPKMEVSEKCCVKCGIIKNISEFHKNVNFPDGKTNVCKDCTKLEKQEYANREKIKVDSKTCLCCGILKPISEFYIRKRSPDGYDTRCKDCNSQITKNNRERINKRNNNRRKNDLDYRIRRRLKSRLKDAIGFKSKKSDSIIKLLGCDIETFRLHLEALFKDGMNWGNYGKGGWHIDHVVPVSWLDLTIPDNQKLVTHYTNLQPLWYWENASKGDKYAG